MASAASLDPDDFGARGVRVAEPTSKARPHAKLPAKAKTMPRAKLIAKAKTMPRAKLVAKAKTMPRAKLVAKAKTKPVPTKRGKPEDRQC